MKPYINITDEKGFSLVEILVVLALTGILGGIMITTYFSMEKSFTEWRQNSILERETYKLIHIVAEDLYKVVEIDEVSAHFISFKRSDNHQVQYELREQNLTRNDRMLNNPDLFVTQFNIETHLLQDSVYDSRPELIRVQLGISNAIDTLHTKTAVHLRNPMAWKPVIEN